MTLSPFYRGNKLRLSKVIPLVLSHHASGCQYKDLNLYLSEFKALSQTAEYGWTTLEKA